MSFVERNQEIEAFSLYRSHGPFTISVRLWSANRRFQNSHAKSFQRFIDGGGENRIAVMDQETVRMVKRQKLAKLLDGPLRSGMRGHIRVQNAPGADLHCNTFPV